MVKEIKEIKYRKTQIKLRVHIKKKIHYGIKRDVQCGEKKLVATMNS
jgi:hypothetical protein